MLNHFFVSARKQMYRLLRGLSSLFLFVVLECFCIASFQKAKEPSRGANSEGSQEGKDGNARGTDGQSGGREQAADAGESDVTPTDVGAHYREFTAEAAAGVTGGRGG